MKKVLLLGILPLFISSNTKTLEIDYEKEEILQLEAKDAPLLISENDLVRALIMVESRGNDSAVGDRHLVGNEAIGALQIRPIMVREVNRILKLRRILMRQFLVRSPR